MKTIYVLLIVNILCIAKLSSQVIHWEEQIITDRSENLQAFAEAEDGSATIIGYGNTFTRTTDGGESWQEAGIFTNGDAFDYQAISFFGDTGFAIAQTNFKVIDHPAGNSYDLVANSPMLKTTDGGLSWSLITVEQMGSGVEPSLNITAVGNHSVKYTAVKIVDANTVYVGAYWKDLSGQIHHNVFKSSNGGDHWESILPDNEAKTITSIENYNGNIYITGKETLYKANIVTDSVTDLYPIVDENEDDAMYFWNITIAGDEIIIPTTSDGIYVSSDEGEHFTTIPNISKGYKVYKHDANHIVVCASKTDVKATSDGGANWSSIPVENVLWNAAVVGDSLVALAKKVIYTMALSDIARGHFSWSAKTITNIDGNLKGIATVGETTFITGYNDIFLKSTDNAQTFTEVTLPSKSDIVYGSVDIELKALAQGKGGAGIAASRRYKYADYPTGGPTDLYRSGFIFKTKDNWATFSVIDDSKIGAIYDSIPSMNPNAYGCYGQDYYSADCIDDTTMYVFVQWYDSITDDKKITNGGVFRTRDGGESWDSICTNLGGNTITAIHFDDEMGYIVGNNTFLKITNDGKTHTDLYPKLTDLGATKPFISSISIKGDTLYVPTSGDGIFVSNDAGNSFSKINEVAGANAFVAVDANSWMTLGSSAKCKYSNDAGANWMEAYPGSTVYSTSGVYNGQIIALSKSKIFKQNIDGLDSDATSIKQNRIENNELKICHKGAEIQIRAECTITHCSVYSISGKVVHQAMPLFKTYAINTVAFEQGIYLVSVQMNNKVITKKVLIK